MYEARLDMELLAGNDGITWFLSCDVNGRRTRSRPPKRQTEFKSYFNSRSRRVELSCNKSVNYLFASLTNTYRIGKCINEHVNLLASC